MAEKKDDKKGKDEAAEGGEAKPKSNKMIIIIVAVVALVIGGAGAGVAVMMMGGKKGGDKTAEESEEKAAKPKEAAYFEMTPPFLVNYQWNGRAHYLQVTIALMTRDPDVLDLVREHTPLIRNNLMLLLAAQDFDGLRSVEGKESVRQLMFDEIQKILKEQQEDTAGIEQLYYTNFVMQ